MRVVALAVLVLVSACSPVASAPSASPGAIATATASAIESAATLPNASPSPVAAPSLSATPLPQPDSRLAPRVTVNAETFAIMTTLRTKLAVVDEDVMNAARFGVLRYLQSIDSYRNGQSPVLPITGNFLAAVSVALKESATPGVRREFQLESLRVDHHVQKPWGTHAYVDVTVTLVDKAVEGNASDQRETGKLRLTGDKLFVTDGWDYEHDRWFNGFGSLPLDRVRDGVAEAAAQYLWFETWVRDTAPAGIYPGSESGFQLARSQRVSAVDRRQVISQLFEGVSATIERFETIEGLWSGVATTRLQGTAVRTMADGRTERAQVDRQIRVFLLGNWSPEVVDEQLPQRDWASGGDLALAGVDQNRA